MIPALKAPLISVIMPVWNGEKYLADAVESILNQTFEEFEFLILDDGSTDASSEILGEYEKKDARIRIIRLEHEGIVLALNRGVEEADSNWIARMDCDDIADPRRFEKQMAAIGKSPDAVLCHTGVRVIGEEQYIATQQRFPRTRAFLAARLCFGCPIVHPTVVFSRKAFYEAGSFLPEQRHAEDYGLWGRMLPLGDFIGIPEPLLSFRVHAGSISKQKAEIQSELTADIAHRHCRLFMNLSERDSARVFSAIRDSRRGQKIKEWFWFVFRCLPRMRWQSAEMWAWALSQTLKRMKKE